MNKYLEKIALTKSLQGKLGRKMKSLVRDTIKSKTNLLKFNIKHNEIKPSGAARVYGWNSKKNRKKLKWWDDNGHTGSSSTRADALVQRVMSSRAANISKGK